MTKKCLHSEASLTVLVPARWASLQAPTGSLKGLCCCLGRRCDEPRIAKCSKNDDLWKYSAWGRSSITQMGEGCLEACNRLSNTFSRHGKKASAHLEKAFLPRGQKMRWVRANETAPTDLWEDEHKQMNGNEIKLKPFTR